MAEDENKVQNTKNKQKTVMDKMLFFQVYLAKNRMMESGIYYEEDARKGYGFHRDGKLKDEEDFNGRVYVSDFFKEYIDKSEAGTYTIKDAREIYRTWAILGCKNRLEMGREQKKIYDSLPDEYDEKGQRLPEAEQIRIKTAKADYLAYGQRGFYSNMEFISQETENQIDEYLNYNDTINKNGHNLQEMIWKDLHFNKNTTTFKDVLDHMEFRGEKRKKYLENIGAQSEDELFYDKYRAFLIKNEASIKLGVKVEDVAESDVILYFKHAYYDAVRSSWIANAIEDFVGNLSLSERKLYETGNKMKMENGIADEFKKWEAEEGIDKSDKLYYKTIIDNLKKTSEIIQSGKTFNFTTQPGIAETFNDQIDRDDEHIRMVIDRLEATKQGHGAFHKTNSDKYEKMLSSMKAYIDAVDRNCGGEAAQLKEKMIKNCLSYISGKEKVRDAGFGNERFKNVMALLSKELEPEKFDALLRTVNRKRGFRADRPADANNEDYVTREKYEEYLNDEGYKFRNETEEAAKKLQNETDHNRIWIPDEYRDVINAIDGIYGRNPKRAGNMSASIFNDEEIQKLKNIDDKLCAVGPCNEGDTLSEKDFVAVSFASAMTPEAFEKTGLSSKAYSPEDNFRMRGNDYTMVLFQEKNSFRSGQYADAIEYGRQNAAEAMKAYKNGDKAPLASILATGIKYLTEETKKFNSLTSEIIGAAEMVSRMAGMVERDKELKKLTLRDGIKEADLNYAKSMKKEAEIYIASKAAQEKLYGEAANNEWSKGLSDPDKRVELITDIIIEETLKGSIKKCDALRDKNPKYIDEVGKIAMEIQGVIKASAALANEPDKEKAKETQDQLTLRNEYLQYKMIQSYTKYRVDNPMIENLNNDTRKKELTESVKEAVLATGMQNLSPQELKKKLSTGNVLRKVAVLNNMKIANKKEAAAKKGTEKDIKVTQETKDYTNKLKKQKLDNIKKKQAKAMGKK